MTRYNFWILTVSFWPEAAEADVRPLVSLSFCDEGPAFYCPREIHFQNPPSRQEFLEVVKTTPWMAHFWNDTLLPVIAANDWPMIDFMHDGSHVDLKDAKGQVVGQLDVSKHDLFASGGYQTAAVYSNEVDRALRGLQGDQLVKAKELLRKSENWLREQYATFGSGEVLGPEKRVELMKAILVKHGLKKPRKHDKTPA